MVDVKIGSVIEGNWGAMHPISEGVITSIKADGFAVVEWEDGEVSEEEISRFKSPGETSKNGSPIGLFVVGA